MDLQLQMTSWDDLQTNIRNLVKNVTSSNIKKTFQELVSQDLLRGRGLLCKEILETSLSSSASIPALASLVALINSKLEEIGILLLKRLVHELRTSYIQESYIRTLNLSELFVHLTVHLLGRFSPPILDNVLGHLRYLTTKATKDIHNNKQNQVLGRSACLIERLYTISKTKNQEYINPNNPGLDIVDFDLQVTHSIQFGDYRNCTQVSLDYFKFDPGFLKNKERYSRLKRTLLQPLQVIDAMEESSGSCVVEEMEESSCSCDVEVMVPLKKYFYVHINPKGESVGFTYE
ncbi:hypothetical protein LIER_08657 [Lithospermum erythrorhizon]|uniref:Uncharacterized protein n=1 Tax=Lithospermum erythrorhizon TaxID=34254 RepID=A0AAV3PEI3_LITER